MFTIKPNSMFWPNVKMLAAFLKKKTIGEVVKYEDMNGHIGTKDIRVENRGVLDKTRLELEEDHIFFECVTKVGIVRIDQEARNKIYTTKGLKGIKRKIRRESQVAANIEYASLSSEGKHQWNVASTVYCGLSNMVKSSSVKRIDGMCKESTGRILSNDELNKLFS